MSLRYTTCRLGGTPRARQTRTGRARRQASGLELFASLSWRAVLLARLWQRRPVQAEARLRLLGAAAERRERQVRRAELGRGRRRAAGRAAAVPARPRAARPGDRAEA